MGKILFIVALLYGAALLQMSFFVHVFPQGLIPNFIILGVVALAVFEKPESYTSFVAALFGGLLLNVFAGGIIGVWSALLLLLSVGIKLVLENYVRISIPQKF